jgi:hypothetical protein
MDITQLARKPQLIEVVLDDEAIVKEYGDAITFYMKDFVDINTYFDFFKSQTAKEGGELNLLMRKIILNKDGEPALADDEGLPIDIAVAALTRINDTLGKSKAKSLTPNNGTQPE